MVPYGTDSLLEPYGFATIQFFYNVNHKNQLPYGSGFLLLPYGNASVSSSCIQGMWKAKWLARKREAS